MSATTAGSRKLGGGRCGSSTFRCSNTTTKPRSWEARHHPFTAPKDGHEDLFETDPGHAIAKAYDVVLNGWELGGGSVRIHRQEVQAKVFRALNISAEDQQRKFGFLLNALQYGAPPHGGIAFGLDRMVAMMAGVEQIRDVIAFPKTQRGQDMLVGAPSAVTEQQLRELHIRMRPSDQVKATPYRSGAKLERDCATLCMSVPHPACRRGRCALALVSRRRRSIARSTADATPRYRRSRSCRPKRRDADADPPRRTVPIPARRRRVRQSRALLPSTRAATITNTPCRRRASRTRGARRIICGGDADRSPSAIIPTTTISRSAGSCHEDPRSFASRRSRRARMAGAPDPLKAAAAAAKLRYRAVDLHGVGSKTELLAALGKGSGCRSISATTGTRSPMPRG